MEKLFVIILWIFILLVTACTVSDSPNVSSTKPREIVTVKLFSDPDAQTDENSAHDPTIVRSRFATIHVALLNQSVNTIGLNLFEDVYITAIRDRVEVNQSGSFSWIGHLEGFKRSQVTLIVKENIVIGNITMPESLYQVRYVGNGIHVIHEMDTTMFPPD